MYHNVVVAVVGPRGTKWTHHHKILRKHGVTPGAKDARVRLRDAMAYLHVAGSSPCQESSRPWGLCDAPARYGTMM